MHDAHKWRIGQVFRPIWGSARTICSIFGARKECAQVEERAHGADKDPTETRLTCFWSLWALTSTMTSPITLATEDNIRLLK